MISLAGRIGNEGVFLETTYFAPVNGTEKVGIAFSISITHTFETGNSDTFDAGVREMVLEH